MDIKNLTVRDIMQTNVCMISPTHSINEAAAKMREQGVSCLILDRAVSSDAFGILTRKDVIDALIIESEVGTTLLIDEVVSKPAIIITSELSAYYCFQAMKIYGVRRFPVVDNGVVVGIVSNTDIFIRLADSLT